MRVFVYYDFTRKCWSVRDEATGRVINYTTTYNVLGQPKRVKQNIQLVELVDCQFRVGKAGQARVRATRRKNVHAGVVGTLVGCLNDVGPIRSHSLTRQVAYNPYKYDTFVNVDDQTPRHSAPRALMLRGQVFVHQENS